MKPTELKKLQEKAAKRIKLRKDPRYIRAIGALERAGLLLTNKKFTGRPNPITYDDLYFAGDLEPRVFETLPALALRRPRTIANYTNMPKDLKELIHAIKRNRAKENFHGARPEKYLFWVNHLRKSTSKDRTLNKIIRFSVKEAQQLKDMQKRLCLETEAEVIRIALRKLADQSAPRTKR